MKETEIITFITKHGGEYDEENILHFLGLQAIRNILEAREVSTIFSTQEAMYDFLKSLIDCEDTALQLGALCSLFFFKSMALPFALKAMSEDVIFEDGVRVLVRFSYEKKRLYAERDEYPNIILYLAFLIHFLSENAPSKFINRLYPGKFLKSIMFVCDAFFYSENNRWMPLRSEEGTHRSRQDSSAPTISEKSKKIIELAFLYTFRTIISVFDRLTKAQIEAFKGEGLSILLLHIFNYQHSYQDALSGEIKKQAFELLVSIYLKNKPYFKVMSHFLDEFEFPHHLFALNEIEKRAVLEIYLARIHKMNKVDMGLFEFFSCYPDMRSVAYKMGVVSQLIQRIFIPPTLPVSESFSQSFSGRGDAFVPIKTYLNYASEKGLYCFSKTVLIHDEQGKLFSRFVESIKASSVLIETQRLLTVLLDVTGSLDDRIKLEVAYALLGLHILTSCHMNILSAPLLYPAHSSLSDEEASAFHFLHVGVKLLSNFIVEARLGDTYLDQTIQRLFYALVANIASLVYVEDDSSVDITTWLTFLHPTERQITHVPKEILSLLMTLKFIESEPERTWELSDREYFDFTRFCMTCVKKYGINSSIVKISLRVYAECTEKVLPEEHPVKAIFGRSPTAVVQLTDEFLQILEQASHMKEQVAALLLILVYCDHTPFKSYFISQGGIEAINRLRLASDDIQPIHQEVLALLMTIFRVEQRSRGTFFSSSGQAGSGGPPTVSHSVEY